MRYVFGNALRAFVATVVLPLGVGAGCSATFNNPLEQSDYNRLLYDPSVDASVGATVADGTDMKAVTIAVTDPQTGLPVSGLKVQLKASGSGNQIVQPSATDSLGQAIGYVKSTKAEDKDVYIVDPVGFEASTASVTFVAGDPSLTTSTITATGPIAADGTTQSVVSATIRDANFNPVSGVTVEYHVTGTNNTPITTLGSPSSCGVTGTNGVAQCTLVSTKAESKTLRLVRLDGATSFDKIGGSVSFVAGAPNSGHSNVSGTSPVFADGISSSIITINLFDVFDNPVAGVVPQYSLSGTGNTLGACAASDADGKSTCAAQSTTAETKNLAVTSPFSLAGGTVQFIPEQPSWIGTTFEIKKWGFGGNPALGRITGAIFNPQAVGLHDSGGGMEIFMPEMGGGRISRFAADTANFLGWLGLVNITPTGGAGGCSAATNGLFTPGWCTGGEAQTAAGNGTGIGELKAARGSYMASDGMLYVSDSSSHRILKYNTVTGVFVGWMGIVGTGAGHVPTGGAAGCTGKVAGDFTGKIAGVGSGGWCKGGFPVAGASTGAGFNSPQGVFVDETVSPNMLYVADQLNNRVSKYELQASDAVNFKGSIGMQGGATCTMSSPTCNGGGVGQYTSCFCNSTTGGFLQTPLALGGLHGPKDVVVAGDNIYVADADNHRINKYRRSGTYVGWIGRQDSTSPLGGFGHPNCVTVGADASNPGWCVGGLAKAGPGDGAFNAPSALYVDYADSTLYVADSGNNRVVKFNIDHATTDPQINVATFDGWVGRVNTTPTSGAAGCSSTAVGSGTPGWCFGGTAKAGFGNGQLSTPSDVEIGSDGYMYITEFDNHRVNRFTASTGAFNGWTGLSLVGKADWNPSTTPAASTFGQGDGMFNNPGSTWVSDDGYLYVADTSNHRITKHDARTGTYVGWIGAIGTSPTGGMAGCAGATVGTFTPGWCTGGAPAQGAADGMMFSPRGITGGVVSTETQTYLYVTDSGNHRVIRFNAATGQPFGWVGRVSSTNGEQPTGSNVGGPEDTNCKGKAPNNPTEYWCVGGRSQSGNEGDGSMNNPRGIAFRGNFIYVADTPNNRIYKIQAQTGFIVGWVGLIGATSPTGGAGACAGAISGTFTPNWCKGGTTVSGAAIAALDTPRGVAADDTYVYVADTGRHRISRYKVSDGQYQGWMGNLGGVAGITGCSGTLNNFSNGWCLTGGTPQASTAGDGSVNAPGDISLSSLGTLFVADTGSHRVNKYNTTAGTFVGWRGRVGNITGLGGAAGCATTIVGDPTPGWCTGGQAQSGNLDGVLNTPAGVTVHPLGTYLYLSDTPNHRIMRYPTP